MLKQKSQYTVSTKMVDIKLMAVTVNSQPIFNTFDTGRFSSKFAVKNLLKIPAHLVCIATLQFVEPNSRWGSVAAFTKCGGIINNHFAANLLENLQVKKFENQSRFERIMTMSLMSSFLGCETLQDAILTCAQKMT